MAAPKGNTNAEKWTRDEVLKQLALIEKEAQKKTCLWLGSALVKVGLYRELWSRWAEKFKDDDEVCQTIKRIDQIFEDRLITKALSGDAHATVSIFALKNNHGWRDQKEIDHTSDGKRITPISFYGDDDG